LREKKLSVVCVDEPQALKSSVPIIAEVTASLGIVRFHERNAVNWEKKGILPNEKYKFLYSDDEFGEWVPKVQRMADSAQQVLVVFKNKHLDFAVRNPLRMKELLQGASL
jgi:uncharacterized protein YecE (DUF72 family)